MNHYHTLPYHAVANIAEDCLATPCRMVFYTPKGARKASHMKEIVFIIEQKDGFIAQAIGHSIFTEADTIENLVAKIRDAVRCHFVSPPQFIALRFSGDVVLT